MPDTCQVAVIQMNSGDDVAVNLRSAAASLQQAAAEGVRLAVLPENFAFMGARARDKLVHAEADGRGEIQTFLAETAARWSMWLIAGTVPLAVPGDPGRVYPASVVYDDTGARRCRYDKIHLFDVDVPEGINPDGSPRPAERYRESASFVAGAPEGLCVLDTPAGRVGLSVCYDLRFPELYRRLGDAGAQLLTVPSAFTESTGKLHWELLLRARAVENQCYVLAPNQCGTHPGGRRTWGHSMIIDPWGAVLAQAANEPGPVIAPVSLATLATLRQNFPALNHRRFQ